MALLVPCPMHECPHYPSCFPCLLASALTKTLALVGGTIHEYLGGNYIAKGQEHLHQLIVSKLLREMVDEEIAAFRTCRHGDNGEGQNREPPKGRGRKTGSTQSTALEENPSTASFFLELPLLLSLSHWSTKGSEDSLRAAGRQYAELEFLESRFTFTACPVPMWCAGHNNSVSGCCFAGRKLADTAM